LAGRLLHPVHPIREHKKRPRGAQAYCVLVKRWPEVIVNAEDCVRIAAMVEQMQLFDEPEGERWQ